SGERIGRWRRRRKGAGRGICGDVFGSRRGSHPSRGGQVVRAARRGDDGAGRRTAQRMFMRTSIVRIKVGSDGSDMRTIRKGDLTMAWCRRLDLPFRALLFPCGGPRWGGRLPLPGLVWPSLSGFEDIMLYLCVKFSAIRSGLPGCVRACPACRVFGVIWCPFRAPSGCVLVPRIEIRGFGP
ncbi:MAG: hypothetical protein ACJA16_001140, partial [Akkermansiaceae bacterium]